MIKLEQVNNIININFQLAESKKYMIECKSEECTSSLSFNNKWMESLLVEVHKNGIFVGNHYLN